MRAERRPRLGRPWPSGYNIFTVNTFGSLKRCLALLLAVLLAGCATPGNSWPERVSHYTRDQAILELGPPERSARLSDGTEVAEWLVRRGEIWVNPMPGGLYHHSLRWPGVGGVPGSVTELPGEYLRLTFDPAGVLRNWKYVAR